MANHPASSSRAGSPPSDPDDLLFDPSHPLKGVVVCCTSISPELRTDIANKTEELGGKHKHDLTPDCTHLVVGEYDTPKYRHVAKERPDVKAMAAGWIEALRNLWVQDADIDFIALEKEWELKPFETGGGEPNLLDGTIEPRRKLLICSTGFMEPEERQHIIDMVEKGGGIYTGDLTRRVTHLVVYKPEGRKYEAAQNWGIRAVSVEWLNDCVDRGLILDEKCYDPLLPQDKRGLGAWNRQSTRIIPSLGKRLRESAAEGQEAGRRKLRKTASIKLNSQRDSLWGSILGVPPAATSSPAAAAAAPAPLTGASQPQPAASAPAPRDPSQQPSGPAQSVDTQGSRLSSFGIPHDEFIFAYCCFYIAGFAPKETEILINTVASLGGVVCQTLDECASASGAQMAHRFLVVPQNSQPNSHPRLPDNVYIITEFYIERCLHKKYFFDPREHVLGQPFPGFPIPDFDTLSISTAGFTGVDLNHVDKAIRQLGARYDWLRSNNVDQKWLSTVTQFLQSLYPHPYRHNLAKCAEISPHVDSLLTFPGLERLDELLIPRLVLLLAQAGIHNADIGAMGEAESLVMKALDVVEKRLCNPPGGTYLILSQLDRLSYCNDTLKPRLVSVANRYLASLINLLTTSSEEFGALSAYMQLNSSATVKITDSHKHAEEHKRVIMSVQDMKSSGFDNPTVLEINHLVCFILNAPACDSSADAFIIIDEIIRVLGFLKRYKDQEIIYRALLRRQSETRLNEPDVDDFTFSPSRKGFEETVDRLCNVLIEQNKYGEAEDLLRTLILSGGHFHGHYFLLGKVLFKQKRFKEAEEMFRKALDLRYIPSSCEKDLTPQTFTEDGMLYYEWLGRTLALQGKHAEAVVCFRQMLEWSQELQILEHPNTLHIYENLSKSLMPLKNYGEAEDILKQGINLMQRKFKNQVDMRCSFLRQLLEVMEAQGKDEDEEFYNYLDQLAKLKGWDTSDSDEDDSSEELNGGSELSPDGSQAGSEVGHSLEHCSAELQVESTSTPVDQTTMTMRITILAHDYDTMNLASQDHERHDQGNAAKFGKPLLNHGDGTPMGRDRQLEDSGVETQAEGHEGALQRSTTPTMEEQSTEVPTRWIQMEHGQGSQIVDEPEDMEVQIASKTLESDGTKRKRENTRDSVATCCSTSTEQPSRKVVRTE